MLQIVSNYLQNMNFQVPSLTVEDITLHVFDKVKVNIMLDDSNIQHQKMRMVLVEPKVRHKILRTILSFSNVKKSSCNKIEI